MTLLEAVEIIEGDEAQDEDVVLAAWQYLHDTGDAYRLQGFYGRGAQRLLEAGLITDGAHA